MKQLILLLSGFTLGFFANNYYFKKAWRVENFTEASAMQAKMSYIQGCVHAKKEIMPEKHVYEECEVKARQAYKDTFEIMTKEPEEIFTVQRSKK